MKILCVISHTHWDREWYMTLERSRLRLVDMMDHCLDILVAYPDYIFHLDAQTVVLEDYLAVRPDRRERLRQEIGAGRLRIGPWYLQNDFFLTSGEATVRNLLTGAAMVRDFGGCYDRVGYAPDQFGSISQLPQILAGFGIDNFIFGRGYDGISRAADGTLQSRAVPAELEWIGSDGTRVLAIHLRFWYNNAQRFSADIERADRMIAAIEQSMEGVAATPYLLLMNGVDHLEAQEDLLPILEKLREKMPPDHTIRQMTLPQYVEAVRDYLRDKAVQLPEHLGELRGGGRGSVLPGTLSSRVYLKQLNDRMQERLESQLEPLYTMLELAGANGVYSRDHFRYLWKKLMRNHPHDSICGCSRDEIHERMEQSYASLFRTTDDLLEQGLQLAADHLADGDARPEEYRIAVVNTLPYRRSGRIEVTADLPVSEDIRRFELLDSAGTPVPFAVLDERQKGRGLFSPINLPGSIEVRRYTLRFLETGVEPMAVKGYRLRRAEGEPLVVTPDAERIAKEAMLENRRLRVTVLPDGRVDLLDKKQGRRIENLLEWEDTGDRGHSYIHGETGGPAVLSNAFPATIKTVTAAYGNRCIIERVLRLPAAYDAMTHRRTAETVDCPVWLELSLEERRIDIRYRIDNRACDHRLRLLVRTDIAADRAVSDAPFDVVERQDDWREVPGYAPEWPVSSFALLQDGEKGLAILTEGQHEFEHLPENRALALTLLRATGTISCNMETMRTGSDEWLSPGGQCQRKLTGRAALYPYEGDYIGADVAGEARRFRTPLLTHFAPVDTRKFTGGRPAVQDTTIGELFFRPDPYAGLRLPDNGSLLRVEGRGVQMTACKADETGSGWILRLVNLDSEPTAARVSAPVSFWSSRLDETRGGYLGEKTIIVPLRPKEIRTLWLGKK